MDLGGLLRGHLDAPHPPFPGAVAAVARRGRLELLVAVGDRLRYADRAGSPLPAEARRPVSADTRFDAASLTKLFTATVVLSLVEDGVLDLDAPLSSYVAHYDGAAKLSVTLRTLLTHTSGLPPTVPLWETPGGRPDRLRAVLSTDLEAPAGSRFAYSCVGFMTATAVVEAVTGQRLDALVEARVCRPLGLADTSFGPLDPARCAATEYDTEARRGLVHGTVHDDSAHALGGVSGNAGVFTTAADLLRFAEAIRLGGALDGARVLREATVEAMLANHLPKAVAPGFGHGLGWRIGDGSFMGPLAAHGAAGHTGFTCTSLVVDRVAGLSVVLLTNRVHPSRDWSELAGVRRAVAAAALDHAAGSAGG